MASKNYLTPVVIIIALAVGFGVGSAYNRYQARGFDGTAPEGADLTTLWQVWHLLHENYVDRENLKPQELIAGAVEGMVRSLGDPHTVFFSPKESKEFAEQIRGEFGGVGIEIGIRDNLLTVIAPIKNTPAARAGLLAGDKILKIEDKSTEGMKVEEAVTLIRGPKGVAVTLTIGRDSRSSTEEIKIIRDIIRIPAVSWELRENDIAYLQVHVFNQQVDQQFNKAAVEITRSPAKRIILDLRNNPGGLLDSAVNLASYFLEKDQIVTIEREGNGKERNFTTSHNAILKNYPIIVLINKGSASASEILAGALRDNRNITLVGEKSFGKGSVQEVFELPNRASVKITFARWFTPNGASIDKDGIAPNVAVELTAEDIKQSRDPQLERAIELITKL